MKAGERISNPVAITWPEVAHGRRRNSLGRAVSEGIQSMEGGLVISTILFDLLDSFRDSKSVLLDGASTRLEQSRSRLVKRHRNQPVSSTPMRRRPISSTTIGAVTGLTSTSSPHSCSRWTTRQRGLAEDGDEEFDEAALQEEPERRQIDEKKGRATGAERDGDKGATDEKMQLAIRRLERRLARAADVIERSLGNLNKLQSVPPAWIARHFGWCRSVNSLVARQVYSKTGTQFVALSPSIFARYILRVARASGGKPARWIS